MKSNEDVEPDLKDLDRELASGVGPDDETSQRVRHRIAAGLKEQPERRPTRWAIDAPALPLVASLAIVALLAVVAGAAGALALSRPSSSSHPFSSTVVPPVLPQQAANGQQQGQFERLPVQDRVAGGAAGASPTYFSGQCGLAPTVQFQGRGLAATGTSVVKSDGASTTTLSVSVQERGADAAAVVNGAQVKVSAVVAALERAGVTGSNILQSNLSSYGDPSSKQFSAYASLQAQLTGPEQVAAATKAVLQVDGVTGYSTGSSLGTPPTAEGIQAAVGEAAAQAKSMAAATATSTGVTFGNVESIVTQPPSTCYTSTGPVRVVQVTVTYAIK